MDGIGKRELEFAGPPGAHVEQQSFDLLEPLLVAFNFLLRFFMQALCERLAGIDE